MSPCAGRNLPYICQQMMHAKLPAKPKARDLLTFTVSSIEGAEDAATTANAAGADADGPAAPGSYTASTSGGRCTTAGTEARECIRVPDPEWVYKKSG